MHWGSLGLSDYIALTQLADLFLRYIDNIQQKICNSRENILDHGCCYFKTTQKSKVQGKVINAMEF